MHFAGFDLNLLVALNALLQEKNVTRAAERVFVTQPAMSHSLGRLRYHFNDALLVRVGRDTVLTARGLALIEPVREMLLRAQAVLGTQAVFEARSLRRTFTLMVPDFIAPAIIPRAMQRLVEHAPGVQLQVENWSSTGPARLLNGAVDLLVTIDNPHIFGANGFSDSICRTTLQTIRWVCAVARDHPLVHDSMPRELLLSLPHIGLQLPGDRQSAVDAVRRRLNVALDIRLATESVLQMPFLLPGTTLVAILPDWLGRRLMGCLDIKLFDVPDDILPERRVEMLWHSRNEPDPAHAWLRSLLAESAAKA